MRSFLGGSCRCCIAVSLFLVLFPINSQGQGWDHDKSLAPSVMIDIGAPHAWTMEQAHYLLERNRAHDLGLAEKDPVQLDPNDTVGFRVQALATLLSASVQFDQSIGTKNRAALQSFNIQMQQYNSALTQRAAVYTQMAQVASSLQTAQQQLVTLQNNPNPDKNQIAQQQSIVDGLNAQNSALNSQLTALNTALTTAPTAPNLTSAIPGSDETTATALGDNQIFDSALKGFSPGTGSSRLSAEQQLDNYINFQYEMVAKQLTLLRDQVGPNNRVLFLELPHSIYVTDKVHLYPYFNGIWGNYLVQSWWTVGGALLSRPLNSNAEIRGAHRPATMLESLELSRNFSDLAKSELRRAKQDADAKLESDKDALNKIEAQLAGCATELQKLLPNLSQKDKEAAEIAITTPCKPYIGAEDKLQDAKKAVEDERQNLLMLAQISNQQLSIAGSATASSAASLKLFFSHAPDYTANDTTATFFNLTSASDGTSGAATTLLSDDQRNFQAWAAYWQYATFGLEGGAPGSSAAPIFALDLIPRQSSLNVASASTSTHQYGFAGVFGWLSGLGARTRYERQRQDFSQFTQIENYATGFGKGDFTFGWTFAPNPGTKRIAPGLRTTYAILVIPKDARVVRLDAMGCGYRRREVPRNPFATDAAQVTIGTDPTLSTFRYMAGPTVQNKLNAEDCGKLHTFDIEVPSSDDDFWIENATYNPVPAGQRVTVRVSGRFGDQTGVLVNGTPLQRVPSVTQPLLTPTGYTVSANAGDSTIQGVFEIVHTRERQDEMGSDLVLSFNMAPTFVGTPKILIVSAAREKLVNEVKLKNGQALLDGDPQGPMFYSLPTITRVDASYSADAKTVTLKAVGRGFTEADDSSLVIGITALAPRKDKAKDPVQDQEFQVLPGGTVLKAILTRAKFFPQWSLDYISTVAKQTVDASGTHDDTTGPAVINTCSYITRGAASGSTSITVTVDGQFFAITTAPSLIADGDDKKITGLSSQVTGTTKWLLTASIPTATKTLTVSIKPSTPLYTATQTCSPPLKKPAASPGAKGKSSNGKAGGKVDPNKAGAPHNP